MRHPRGYSAAGSRSDWMRILIIDDSTVMRTFVAEVVGKLDSVESFEAPNGIQGLKALETFKPDLVLLDWDMPCMDGITWLKRVRAMGCKVPVILVTSMADKANVVEAVKAGANNYCIKPFTADTLHKCIEKSVAAAKKAA